MWGQELYQNISHLRRGIIPTRVGTRVYRFPLLPECKDHPHACGDKPHSSTLPPFRIGSSPRVWGQDFFDVSFDASYGIIPTRVGTSLYRYGKEVYNEDHPHACGDKEDFC